MQASNTTSKLQQLKQQYIQSYSFTYKQLFKDSWKLTKGAKGSILSAVFFYLLIGFLINNIKSVFTYLAIPVIGNIFKMAANITIMYPLSGGLWLFAIQKAAGKAIKASALFSSINWYNIRHLFIVNLWLIILYAIVIVPAVSMLILSGAVTEVSSNFTAVSITVAVVLLLLYIISIVYFMAIPLVISQRISGWHALTLSRIAINKHFFKIFFLGLLEMAIFLLTGLCTIGIAWIWVIPWLFIVNGRLFTTVFSLPKA